MQEEFFFHAVIYGVLYGKANSRNIVKNRHTGKMMVIKQKGALAFEKAFLKQVVVPCGDPHEGSVAITATVYYPDRRQDLEIELLKDCIEKVGILKNDKQIVRYKDVVRRIDKENPRVEFSLMAEKENGE